MKKENTSLRLQKIMELRGLKQIDILNLVRPYCEKFGVKMNKSHLSQYVSGKSEPGQDRLAVLGMALDINEAWLMGYDVPMERAETLIEIHNHDNNALMQRRNAYWTKYIKCSEAGQEKINKYIDNVYGMEQAEKEVSVEKVSNINHATYIYKNEAPPCVAESPFPYRTGTSASNDNNYLTPVAAHNDDTSEEQIKLMREDLDEL